MSDKRKKRREWELEMVTEWLSQTFPHARYQTQVRLGRIQPRNPDGQFTDEEKSMIGLWRRRIDCIVFLPDRLLLVEAILRALPGKLMVLKLYEKLVRQTPELSEFFHLPIQKILLYAIEDPVLLAIAREEGITPIRFVPRWYDEWLETLRPRDRRASLSTFGESP